ncbi:hypothetical protein EV2_038884 [Malus domestica]
MTKETKPNKNICQKPKPIATRSTSIHSLIELASGCVGMHSVTTITPQRDGGGEADVITEHYIEELPSALIGYSLPHPSRPLIKHFAFFSNCESLFLLLPLAWSVSSEVIRSRSSLRYKKLPFTRMDTQTFCSFIYSKPLLKLKLIRPTR